MSSRVIALVVGVLGVAVFAVVRPNVPLVGSDCEALAAGLLREPVAAWSSLAIVIAGWVVTRHRAMPGIALLLAGMASFAAHASAHPTARALDGILAAAAVLVVVWSLMSDRPDRTRLGIGLGIGSIAVVSWVLTRTDAALCDAVGPWGHATWHVLVAAAAVVALVHPRTATTT